MMYAQWLAHGGAADAGPVLVMLVPAGILYGIGLLLVFIPIVRAINQPPPSEADKLATQMLGNEEAQEMARRSRRLRSIRRREVREVLGEDAGRNSVVGVRAGADDAS
jgi:Zn-dependent protease with chaperone function